MDIWGQLLNVVEPTNNAVRSGIDCGMLRWSVRMCNTAPKSMVQNLVKTITMERSSLSPMANLSLSLQNQKATGLSSWAMSASI